MLDMILNFFSTTFIYSLIVPGLILGVGAIVFSFFIPKVVEQYKIAFLIGGIATVLFFTFYDGRKTEAAEWQAKVEAQKLEIERWRVKSGEVTIQTITKYVEKIKLVDKVRTEYQTVYVDRIITPEIDLSFPVPNGFVKIHNSAINRTEPIKEESDSNKSVIPMSVVSKTVSDNYLICKKTETQLESLQQWVLDQKKLAEEPTK